MNTTIDNSLTYDKYLLLYFNEISHFIELFIRKNVLISPKLTMVVNK